MLALWLTVFAVSCVSASMLNSCLAVAALNTQSREVCYVSTGWLAAIEAAPHSHMFKLASDHSILVTAPFESTMIAVRLVCAISALHVCLCIVAIMSSPFCSCLSIHTECSYRMCYSRLPAFWFQSAFISLHASGTMMSTSRPGTSL